MTIRLHLRRLKHRFLGLFREVRELRTMESKKNAEIQRHYAVIAEQRTEREESTAERLRLGAKLEETKRGLATTMEARLNADRQIELLRGILEGNAEISAREVAGMKQTVDCFALQVLGRQVYGTAPLAIRSKEADEPVAPRRMSIREVQRDLRQEFLDEAVKRGHMEPPAQPEYTSKSVNGSANVT